MSGLFTDGDAPLIDQAQHGLQVLLCLALRVAAGQGKLMRNGFGFGLLARHLEHSFAHHDRDPLVALLPFVLLFDQLELLRQCICGLEYRTGRLRDITAQLVLQLCGYHGSPVTVARRPVHK